MLLTMSRRRRAEGGLDVIGLAEDGEDDDLDVRVPLPDALEAGEAVHAVHANVEQKPSDRFCDPGRTSCPNEPLPRYRTRRMVPTPANAVEHKTGGRPQSGLAFSPPHASLVLATARVARMRFERTLA